MASNPRKKLEEWLKGIKLKDKKIADVGGEQLGIRKRLGQCENCIIDTYDLPQWDLSEAWLDRNVFERYDVVFCLEVFEYILNPTMAMANLRWLLKPGGKLYTSWHFIYPHHEPKGTDFLRYTRWAVEKLHEKEFMEIEEIEPRYFDGRHIIGCYLNEGMKALKPYEDELHYEQGYLVQATKVERKQTI